nr:MAG: polyprotein [Coypu hunnivirus]
MVTEIMTTTRVFVETLAHKTNIMVFRMDDWFEEDFPEPLPEFEVDFVFDLSDFDTFIEDATIYSFQGAGQSKSESGNTNNSGNHGVINMNWYNTQYQNSADLHGAMSTEVTDYSHGDSASQTTSNTNRPTNLLTTGLQFATSVLPLLADSTTEEFENSDRIAKCQRGTTTVVTQATVGVRTYRGGEKSGPTSCADEETTGGPSIERFISLTVGNWQSTDAAYKCWVAPLPYVACQQDSPLYALARRHYTLKCGWHVQVQVNSTRFHGGALGVFMVPELLHPTAENVVPTPETEFILYEMEASQYQERYSPQGFFLYPHQIINPRTNSSAEIKVPYVGPTPTSDPRGHAPWSLVVMVLDQLSYGNGATTSLTINASIAPIFHHFHGLRQANTTFQGPPKAQLNSATALFASTQAHYSEPVYGMMYRSSPHFLPGKFEDLLAVAQTPTLVRQRSVTFNQAVPTTPLIMVDVSLSHTDLSNTSLETVSRGFAQYRGSIDVTLLFTGNQMQSVRFLCAYTPPGAGQPTTLTEAMQGTYTIYDTGLNASHTFTIPYISTMDFRMCNANFEGPQNSGGYFSIWQYTALAVPPQSPATANLLVFVAAGADFQFRQVTAPYLQLQGETTQLQPMETGVHTSPTAANTNEHPTPIPYQPKPTRHTALRFWFDRFFVLDSKSVRPNDAWEIELSLPVLFKNQPEILAMTHATYIRFELEVAISLYSVTNIANTSYMAVFYPPGTKIPTGNVAWNSLTSPAQILKAGPVPSMHWQPGTTTPVATFRLPFTAPVSVLPFTYNGFKDFSYTNNYGACAGASLGTLYLYSTGNTSSPSPLKFYARLVDIECFCPRPGMYLEPPAPQSRGMTNFDLLKIAGDVELNPGPSFSKFMKLFMSDDADEMFKDLEGAMSLWKNLKSYAGWAKLWEDADKKKWLKKALKLIALAIICLKAKNDPLLVAATVFLVKGDLFTSLVKTAKKTLKDLARTEPPSFTVTYKKTGEQVTIKQKRTDLPKTEEMDPCEGTSTSFFQKFASKFDSACGLVSEEEQQKCKEEVLEDGATNPFFVDCLVEQPNSRGKQFFAKICKTFNSKDYMLEGPTQTFNSLVALCRNAQWIWQQLDKFVDWVKRWMKQEEEAAPDNFRQRMQDYPTFQELYQRIKFNVKSPQYKACKEYFDEMRRLAAYHDPKFLNLFPIMTGELVETTRVEPVLVVLRGPPGQGKSVAAAILCQLLSAELGEGGRYYSYNASTKYFDGYDQQAVVLVDDLAQNPNGEDFSVFCQMISTTTFYVNKADLKDKGMPFTSKVIVVTTNQPEFRPTTISDPGALKRRIQIDLTVTAGDNYKTPQGTLNFHEAIKPTGLTSPLTYFRKDIALTSSACINFKKGRSCNMSLIDVFTETIGLLRRKENNLEFLQEILKLEGPKRREPPSNARVTAFCNGKRHVCVNQEDQLVLRLLERVHFHPFVIEFIDTFYAEKKDEKMEKFLYWTNVIITVCSFLLMVFTFVYFIYTVCFQGPYTSDVVKRNLKREDFVKIVDFQGPNATNMEMEQSLLEKNVVPVKYKTSYETEEETTGLFVKGRYLLLNQHLHSRMKAIDFGEGFIPLDGIPVARPRVNQCLTDVVVLDFTGKPGRSYRDITKSFVTKEELVQLQPKATGRGICKSFSTPFLFSLKPFNMAQTVRTDEGPIGFCLRYHANTAAGYCGSPVVVDNGYWKKITGIHSAGAHGVGVASMLTQDLLLKVLDAFKPVQLQGKIKNARPHPFVYTPTKTSFLPTILNDEKTTVEPAALSAFDPRLEDPKNFKKNIMAKHVGDRTDGPRGMLIAARVYARLLKAKLGNVTGRLTLEEAVEGIPGLDPMDMTKSPGLPYLLDGKRRPQLYKNDGLGNVYLDPVLYSELSLFLDGKFDNHKFMCFLKDELRPKEKVKKGKTRIIDVASFGHAITGRMLFGRLAAAMHAANGPEIGSAVGCNPDVDWTRYAHTFKYDNFIDIDYSGFDATHTTFSFECLKVCLKEMGFDDVALAYVDSLCNSTHVWDDEEFEIQGGLPSGCSCTSIFNTMMNNIVVRAAMAYVGVPFQMLAYGDDCVLCCEEPFDLDEYKYFMSLTNYKITPASKDGDFKWTNLEGVVFLKRYFRMDGMLCRPVMNRENLWNIMSWARAGTVQEKVLGIGPLAHHAGKAFYEALVGPFEECGFHAQSFDNLEEGWLDLFY